MFSKSIFEYKYKRNQKPKTIYHKKKKKKQRTCVGMLILPVSHDTSSKLLLDLDFIVTHFPSDLPSVVAISLANVLADGTEHSAMRVGLS